MRDRAQLSLPLVEAGIGVVLVFSITFGFALGTPAADTAEPQLDALARDALSVLASEPPRHRGATRLDELTLSRASFDRERSALVRRIDRILPDNVLFEVATGHGRVGHRRPPSVAVGWATRATLHGSVTIWVWYA